MLFALNLFFWERNRARQGWLKIGTSASSRLDSNLAWGGISKQFEKGKKQRSREKVKKKSNASLTESRPSNVSSQNLFPSHSHSRYSLFFVFRLALFFPCHRGLITHPRPRGCQKGEILQRETGAVNCSTDTDTDIDRHIGTQTHRHTRSYMWGCATSDLLHSGKGNKEH